MNLGTTVFSRPAVVGGGLMGAGIAARLALAGARPVVHDSAPDAQARVRAHCQAIVEELQAAGCLDPAQAADALGRVQVAHPLEALADASLVIEAIPESLGAKQALYTRLEAIVGPGTVIASSTSGLLPTTLAEPLTHPERFLIAHFWNPPHLMPLVEVVPAPATRRDLLDAVMSGLEHHGCAPVLLHQAVPGFIGNRIQFAVLREALHLLREHVADANTIDRVVRETLGRRYHRIGPLEGADAGGLDTFLAIATHLMPTLAKDEDVLALLQTRVQQGQLGRKSGQGLVTWDTQRQDRFRQARRDMLNDLSAP
ncbi:3-hydroxyacyl-CoA dehydrogenase family protein [Hydrogenophaga electricum]|uniref:L-gulonate 3-dehydrogenase n=1 Tax=Hydrogenophaga electricum TaxID=1230953 RepID=A0ABQ6C6S5_9BURK|nr:3-hydroxyacyl-CoA dehydrogenase family protein [Hydrogenophaga electricum]GLS16022.1 3-hydroxybutyryl-CoA dehydrogenase [Hydrogenophaga electricum]